VLLAEARALEPDRRAPVVLARVHRGLVGPRAGVLHGAAVLGDLREAERDARVLAPRGVGRLERLLGVLHVLRAELGEADDLVHALDARVVVVRLAGALLGRLPVARLELGP